MAKKFTDLDLITVPLIDTDIFAVSKDVNEDQTLFESQKFTLADLKEAIGVAPKVYKALLTQSGTDAPVATVLVNTLSGTPVWSRSTDGQYLLTLNGEFISSKTFILLGSFDSDNSVSGRGYINGCVISSDEIRIQTTDSSNAVIDGQLYNTSILIEVYP